MNNQKKILMVSMASIHFFRWANQLKDTGYEVYWFDVYDSKRPNPQILWVRQIVGWKLHWDYPGRHWIKKRLPWLYKLTQKVNERNTAKVFETYLKQIQPDIVHSFALYVSVWPILIAMKNNRHIKWAYSAWGSDLFYFQNEPDYLSNIKTALPYIDFLFTDCSRDYNIAKTYGFSGEFLGVFPGGGGFEFKEIEPHILPVSERKTILIKGYQGRSGRSIEVLKAMKSLKKRLQPYKIIVFGADAEVVSFANESGLLSWANVEVLSRVSHKKVLQFMGESLVYIGNSNSDGMPNTLLEAICFGAFPIQSNPGGASAEIIDDGENGLLINNCDDVGEIKVKIEMALSGTSLFETAFNLNMEKRKPLEYEAVKKQVVKAYRNML